MTLPSISARFGRQRARNLIRFHPFLRKLNANAEERGFITCTGKRDGAGAQALAVFSTIAFAKDVGLQYVHTPFQSIQHNSSSDPCWEEKWERFFNLGTSELPIQELMAGLERVQLTSVLELPFKTRKVLYVTRHAHDYVNRCPDRYLEVIDSIISKYFSSTKIQLRSYYDPSKLNIAIHVRRGDVDRHGPNADRYSGNELIHSIVNQVLSVASPMTLPPSLHLYSEGDIKDFGLLRDMGIVFHLNECPFSTFHNLVTADVLLMSKSAFSYSAALLSNGVKIYEPFSYSDSPRGGTLYNHKPLTHWVVVRSNGGLGRSKLYKALERLSQMI